MALKDVYKRQVLTEAITGLMINKVRNKASPTRIWLGGDCCVPRAFRRNDSTITILVKLVIIMIREGTTARNRNKNIDVYKRQIAHRVHAKKIHQGICVEHVALGLAHLTVALQQPWICLLYTSRCV